MGLIRALLLHLFLTLPSYPHTISEYNEILLLRNCFLEPCVERQSEICLMVSDSWTRGALKL